MNGVRLHTGLLLGVVLGCSSGQAPPPSSAEPAPAPAQGVAEPAAASDAEPSAAPAAEPKDGATAGTEPAAAPAPKSVRAVCEEMCDAIAPKCNKDQQALCKLNCGDYAAAKPACEEVTREALACIRDAPDFLMCSGVVPERCSKKFRARQTCEEQGAAPTSKDPEGYPVPDGWAMLEATEPRFRAAMPKAVETKTEGGIKKWVAAGASGSSFEIAIHPAPPEKKVDQRVFLKVATKLLGRCADKMKLHALVEKPDRSVIHYATKCPDKSERRGLLYVFGGNLFVLTVRWDGTPPPEADAFVYNFEPG